jgi:tight adherence protein B
MSLIWVAVLVFATVLGAFWAGLFAWNDFFSPHAAQQATRLSAIQAMSTRSAMPSLRFKRVLSLSEPVARNLKKFPLILALDTLLVQAGIHWRMDQFLTLLLLCEMAVIGVVLALSLSVFTLLFSVIFVVVLFLAYVSSKKQTRSSRIEAQLPESLDLISQAMLAGHALSSAILLAANEGADPIASELRIVFDEINYGISTREAMLALADRNDSEYVRLFVTSVLIQIDTGGNMAEMLKNTSFLIRDRKKFKSAARVLTAEARISAWILGALPFAIVGLLMLLNPAFISVLWRDELGLKLMMMSFSLMVAGSLWMWRLIRAPY